MKSAARSPLFLRLAAVLAGLAVLATGASAEADGSPRSLAFHVVAPSLSRESRAATPTVELQEAQARWQAAGLTSYTISVRTVVFGPNEVDTVTVTNGAVTAHERTCTLGDRPFDCSGPPSPQNYIVPGLFTRAAPAPPVAPPITVTATFDQTYGYPTTIYRIVERVTDANTFREVTSFVPAR